MFLTSHIGVMSERSSTAGSMMAPGTAENIEPKTWAAGLRQGVRLRSRRIVCPHAHGGGPVPGANPQMESYESRIKGINEARLRAFDAGQELVDRASRERRDMTHEETAAFDRAMEEIKRLDKKRDDLIASEGAQREI